MPEEVNADQLIRAISLLTALRDSIKDAKEHNDLSDSHVIEFHSRLADIQSMNIDTTEFLIPDSQVKPEVRAVSVEGTVRYSEEKYVRKSIFLTKLNGILTYLNYILKEPDKTIGFKGNK